MVKSMDPFSATNKKCYKLHRNMKMYLKWITYIKHRVSLSRSTFNIMPLNDLNCGIFSAKTDCNSYKFLFLIYSIKTWWFSILRYRCDVPGWLGMKSCDMVSLRKLKRTVKNMLLTEDLVFVVNRLQRTICSKPAKNWMIDQSLDKHWTCKPFVTLPSSTKSLSSSTSSMVSSLSSKPNPWHLLTTKCTSLMCWIPPLSGLFLM